MQTVKHWSWNPRSTGQGERSKGAQDLVATKIGYQSQGLSFMETFYKASDSLIEV